MVFLNNIQITFIFVYLFMKYNILTLLVTSNTSNLSVVEHPSKVTKLQTVQTC